MNFEEALEELKDSSHIIEIREDDIIVGCVIFSDGSYSISTKILAVTFNEIEYSTFTDSILLFKSRGEERYRVGNVIFSKSCTFTVKEVTA